MYGTIVASDTSGPTPRFPVAAKTSARGEGQL